MRPVLRTLPLAALLALCAVAARCGENGAAAEEADVSSAVPTCTYAGPSEADVQFAADAVVDRDTDGYTDDLNGDGVEDVEDARVLFVTAEGLGHEVHYFALEGGLGLYDATPAYGPFVHVDVRGERMRWGP